MSDNYIEGDLRLDNCLVTIRGKEVLVYEGDQLTRNLTGDQLFLSLVELLAEITIDNHELENANEQLLSDQFNNFGDGENHVKH